MSIFKLPIFILILGLLFIRSSYAQEPWSKCMQEEEKYPLHEAAYDGNIEEMRCLLENGYDLNALDINGNTAIIRTLNRNFRSFQFLLESKIDINFSKGKSLHSSLQSLGDLLQIRNSGEGMADATRYYPNLSNNMLAKKIDLASTTLFLLLKAGANYNLIPIRSVAGLEFSSIYLFIQYVCFSGGKEYHKHLDYSYYFAQITKLSKVGIYFTEQDIAKLKVIKRVAEAVKYDRKCIENAEYYFNPPI